MMKRKVLTKGMAVGIMVALLLVLPGFATQAYAESPVYKHSKKEIMNYLQKMGTENPPALTYRVKPVRNTVRGDMTQQSKQAALNMLNSIRYIAGINANVKLDANYGNLAQAGAFVNWSIGELTHYPKNKPAAMSQANWSAGVKGAGSSNLAMGYGSLTNAVLAWTYDEDPSNVPHVGHRMWTLNPEMGKVGFGAAGGFYAEYVFDGSGTGKQVNIAWPARYMPVEFFGSSIPWSLTTNKSGLKVKDKVSVTLTRRSGSPSGYKQWKFSNSQSYSPYDYGAYFSVKTFYTSGAGSAPYVVFRPANISYRAGDIFDVNIQGLGDKPIKYTVEFFHGYKQPQSVGRTTIRNTIANTQANPKYNDVIYDKVAGATSYDVAYRHVNSSNWVVRNVGNTIRGRMSGLSIRGLYQVKVRARKPETDYYKPGIGEYSPVVYRYFFTVQKIRLASRSNGSFTMSWDKDPGATGYQVMFTTNSNGAGAAKNINTVSANATSFTKTGLKSGVTYYVQVRAIKNYQGKNYIGNISCPVAVKVK